MEVTSEGPASRVVLVTGSGQGIGRQIAIDFARRGDSVAVVDINLERAEAVAAEIRAGGASAGAYYCDVSEEGSVRSAVEAVERDFGTIHVLINNAALFSSLVMKPFEEISVEEWDTIFSVNARGVFLCCRAVAPIMRRQKFGRIVNFSSSVVVTGRANYAHYVASKGAVQAFNKSLATELGSDNITANVVSPHGIETEIPRETISEDQW
ncbi:MAG TPA: SDR family oxidoreductase, partial [Candidatus Agrococcus pullicola]|nr:SDR family oxidoreductase [Candidatus Agrococcus pullicola]